MSSEAPMIMNEWSFQTLAQMNSLPGMASQIPTHLKPPLESGILEDDSDSTSSFSPFAPGVPCLQRLPSPSEESYNRTFSGGTNSPLNNIIREDPPPVTFGNSLDVQGTASTTTSSEAPPDIFVQSGFIVPSAVVGAISDSNIPPSAIHQRDIIENPSTFSPIIVNNSESSTSNVTSNNSINNIKYVVDPNRPSVDNKNDTTNVQSSSSSFPHEPTILADKYAVLGHVDAATCHGILLINHETVHIKAVSSHTAREVCAHQSILDQSVGVRSPREAIMSSNNKKAWLIFSPHFGDLHSYVRLRRRLREAEAQRLFSQMVTTVENCHLAGIVLRDLKLRKFVFSDSSRQQVVLESLEDSVAAGESDLLHDKHGCPAYVAPEILSASAYSGRYADMWGLGVILYTMLVGRYPFHNADTTALFAKIRTGKFFIPEWVSSRARHLILSLLKRIPQRRLTAQQVLLHPWLNRIPRDHVGKEPYDHMVPSG